MTRNLASSASKFLAGLTVGAVLFSGSAFAYNYYVSDNTPEGGYILCANNKTKAVTFPNKLSCPAGTTVLDMGAAIGAEGPEGPQGPQGPQGASGNSSSGGAVYQKTTPVIDIVADGTYSKFSELRKVVLGKISPQDLPTGYYTLSAYVDGLWGDGVRDGSILQCYFQYKKDFDANGNHQRGSDATENGNWTGIFLNPKGSVWFTASSDDPVYLVCAAGGTVKSLDSLIIATKSEYNSMKNTMN
jgi:hypothetical protein